MIILEVYNYILSPDEANESLVSATDDTAHITLFNLMNPSQIYGYILFETEIKGVPYLWIGAIPADEQNHEMKKETI